MNAIEESLEYIKKAKALMESSVAQEENMELLAVATLMGVAQDILEIELKNPPGEKAAE